MRAEAARGETIVALGTPPGRGALAVLRLSGPSAFAVAERIAGALPPARQAALRSFRDADGEVLDRGLLLLFPGPGSYTGEDLAELQLHGSPVATQLLIETAIGHGARLARPGEFTERAFLNDRLDLAQAEAVADLIDAGSRAALRAANRSLSGEFSRRIAAIDAALTDARVFVEGALDFSDEDIDWLSDAALGERLAALRAQLAELLAQAAQGRRLRDGLVVAIAGRPNVGKSTLLNALAGHEAAIVTEVAGTTRDLLREHLQVDGLPVTVIDTAGLRETADPVEVEGIRRARRAISEAELVLYLVDDREGLRDEDRAVLAALPTSVERWVLRNKCDLSAQPPGAFGDEGLRQLRLSAQQGAGLTELRAALGALAGGTDAGEGAFIARTRHIDALDRALAAVEAASARIADRDEAVLAAEDLRVAQEALAEITGRISADELLGRIFAGFCIGK